MKITVAAIGRLKAGPERDLAKRYAERFEATARPLGLTGPVITEYAESLARSVSERKAQEAQMLLSGVTEDAALIQLDERGETVSSEVFARKIEKWRDSGRKSIVFAIGGADGHGALLSARADQSLSFGAMTLPHQLLRVVLLEQLYRAATILSGHPYHRV